MSLRGSVIGIVVLLAVMVVFDVARGVSVPGSSAVFGLVACVVLIVVPKWLGTRWLWRDVADVSVDLPSREDG